MWCFMGYQSDKGSWKLKGKENYHISVVRHWSDADVPDIPNNIDLETKCEV